MSHHARRIARFAGNSDDRGLIETILRNDAARNQGYLVAALVMVNDLWHDSSRLRRFCRED